MHPHAAVDRLAAAVGAGLRAARALAQLERDVAAVDPDRRGAHEAELPRLRGRLDVDPVDLDLGAGRREHVTRDLKRRLEAAVGPTAAGARGEVQEEKVDSKHWVLAVLFSKRRRRHEKDAQPSGRRSNATSTRLKRDATVVDRRASAWLPVVLSRECDRLTAPLPSARSGRTPLVSTPRPALGQTLGFRGRAVARPPSAACRSSVRIVWSLWVSFVGGV
jgi:hypothetical protein